MDPAERDQWREADRHLAALLELDGAMQARALAGLVIEPGVREKLGRLLAGNARDHPLLGGAAREPAGRDDGADESRAGRLVGDWRLTGVLGHGGTASVWRAERSGHDYTHAAAVKLLHQVLADPATEARFRRERQILARLDHPHIARLIDGGIAGDGTPYLVMALVEGERIDQWCDREQASPRQRVELALEVCEATAYAHRQLVIHRDIKPGNILVDGQGRAVLLDFGIARIQDDTRPEATVTRAFTPGYAAPEQRAGRSDLGTAVDVYGLGAVLHRLLAGSPPQLDARDGLVAPSRSALMAGSEARARLLRGDLDAILARALENDPGCRYESVDALAADLRRWLDHRPVAARPRSSWRRLGKLLRRNPLPSALATACLGLALAGTALLVRNQLLLEQHARELQSVVDFQSAMFGGLDAGELGARLRGGFVGALDSQAPLDPALREELVNGTDFTGIAVDLLDATLLGEAVAAARERFPAQPAIRAALLQDLATIYYQLFRFDAARPVQDEASALFLDTLGPAHPRTLASLRQQVWLARDLGEDGELELAERSLALHRRHLGERDPATALAMADLGTVLISSPDTARAETLLREALPVLESAYGAVSWQAALARGHLGMALAQQGRHAEAAPEYEAAIDAYSRARGARAVAVLEFRNLLAWGHGRLGHPERAHAEYQALHPLYVEVFGRRDPRTLNLLNNVAAWPRRAGDHAGAEPLQREAYEGMLRALGPAHPMTVRMQVNLAEIALHLGRPGEARGLLETALAQPRLGDSATDLPRIQSLLGQAAQASGDLDAAREWYAQAWRSAASPSQPALQREVAGRLSALDATPPGQAGEAARRPALAVGTAPSTDPSPAGD
ncbi:MAG: serine/threonine protein kinase [Xanthomonadales bacterium]|nr:serine/threonine protein kinase [Xanthomonadales bacterium]